MVRLLALALAAAAVPAHAGAPAVDGLVVDPSGRPLEGVEVWVVPASLPSAEVAALRTERYGTRDATGDARMERAFTGRNGRFRLPRLAPADVLLAGWPDGPLRAPAGVDLAARPLRVVWPAPLRVRGEAVGRDGKPIAELEVGDGGWRHAARFDAQVSEAVAASGWIGVGTRDHRYRWFRVAPGPGGVQDLGRVVLEPGSKYLSQRQVSIRLVDEAGAPVTNAAVAAGPPGPSWQDPADRRSEAVSVAPGRYALEVGDGPADVTVAAPGRALARIVVLPDERERTVVLGPGGTLVVRFPEGSVPPLARRLLVEGPAPIGAIRTAAGEVESLAGLPPGRYEVRVAERSGTRWVPGGPPDPSYAGSAVDVAAGRRAEVTLAVAPARGSATLHVEVPPGVCLRLVEGEGPRTEAQVRGLLGYAPISTDEGWVFHRVPPGGYTLVAWAWRAGGLQVASERIEVRGGTARLARRELLDTAPLLPITPAVGRPGELGDDCGGWGPIGEPHEPG